MYATIAQVFIKYSSSYVSDSGFAECFSASQSTLSVHCYNRAFLVSSTAAIFVFNASVTSALKATSSFGQIGSLHEQSLDLRHPGASASLKFL